MPLSRPLSKVGGMVMVASNVLFERTLFIESQSALSNIIAGIVIESASDPPILNISVVSLLQTIIATAPAFCDQRAFEEKLQPPLSTIAILPSSIASFIIVSQALIGSVITIVSLIVRLLGPNEAAIVLKEMADESA